MLINYDNLIINYDNYYLYKVNKYTHLYYYNNSVYLFTLYR